MVNSRRAENSLRKILTVSSPMHARSSQLSNSKLSRNGTHQLTTAMNRGETNYRLKRNTSIRQTALAARHWARHFSYTKSRTNTVALQFHRLAVSKYAVWLLSPSCMKIHHDQNIHNVLKFAGLKESSRQLWTKPPRKKHMQGSAALQVPHGKWELSSLVWPSVHTSIM